MPDCFISFNLFIYIYFELFVRELGSLDLVRNLGYSLWFEADLHGSKSIWKVNLDKSDQFTLVGEVPNVKGFGPVLGCKMGKVPIAYLGLSFGTQFDMVEERFHKRLAPF